MDKNRGLHQPPSEHSLVTPGAITKLPATVSPPLYNIASIDILFLPTAVAFTLIDGGLAGPRLIQLQENNSHPSPCVSFRFRYSALCSHLRR